MYAVRIPFLFGFAEIDIDEIKLGIKIKPDSKFQFGPAKICEKLGVEKYLWNKF